MGWEERTLKREMLGRTDGGGRIKRGERTAEREGEWGIGGEGRMGRKKEGKGTCKEKCMAMWKEI
ncbi:MAG: hypothetical protein J5374_03775 [Bacteroidales bacterium]|nr:hypothetical protein [Bacteroidales bacterium]